MDCRIEGVQVEDCKTYVETDVVDWLSDLIIEFKTEKDNKMFEILEDAFDISKELKIEFQGGFFLLSCWYFETEDGESFKITSNSYMVHVDGN